MKYILVFTLFAAFIAFVCAKSLSPGDDAEAIGASPWIRVRRGSCDFFGCQRYCYNLGDGTGPKGGGVCINNHCDCNVLPKDP